MTKTKKTKTLEVEPIEVSRTSLWTHRIVGFLQDHGSSVLYGIIAAAAVLAILYQLTRSSESHQFADYMKADRVYHQFVQDTDPETLENLKTLIARHPDLEQKYGGKIAQTLIAHDQSQLAEPYIKELVERSQEEGFPLFLEFTKSTEFITQGDYKQAYESSLNLQKQLAVQSDIPYTQSLYAYNLLRLASLERVLGFREKELARWEEILAVSKENEAVMSMLRHLQEGHVNLTSYIEYRIAQLQGENGSSASSLSNN